MFIVYPTNVDYLISDVRLQLGDVDGEQFSDSVVRAGLISAVKFLERRWGNRYLVYASGIAITPVPVDVTVPAGYMYVTLPDGNGLIPNGYVDNDIFRNPYHTFLDEGTYPISQEDESIIVTVAIIVLLRSRLTSSSSAFVNWTDGEYSYSNVATSNVLRDIYRSALDDLNLFFKRRLARPVRGDFPEILI